MFSVQRTALIFSISIALTSVTTLAVELPDVCDSPQILLVQDQIRRSEGWVGETHCYRLDLESSGLLHLDVLTGGALPTGARVEILEGRNTVGGSAKPQVLFQTATERLALVGAGTYFLEVASEDPQRPLPAYRLQSRFVAMDGSETNGELELEPELMAGPGLGTENSETNGELELEPELLVSPGLGLGTENSETNGELELEPELMVGLGTENSETNGELELEPELITETQGGSDGGPALLNHLCLRDAADDHGDSFACATTFNQSATGELGNGWGDDADVFRLEILRWQTVEISIHGESGILGTLCDDRGQRLGRSDREGENEDSRWVRTLGPGTYFLRVEGLDSMGSYRLVVEDLGR